MDLKGSSQKGYGKHEWHVGDGWDGPKARTHEVCGERSPGNGCDQFPTQDLRHSMGQKLPAIPASTWGKSSQLMMMMVMVFWRGPDNTASQHTYAREVGLAIASAVFYEETVCLRMEGRMPTSAYAYSCQGRG